MAINLTAVEKIDGHYQLISGYTKVAVAQQIIAGSLAEDPITIQTGLHLSLPTHEAMELMARCAPEIILRPTESGMIDIAVASQREALESSTGGGGDGNIHSRTNIDWGLRALLDVVE